MTGIRKLLICVLAIIVLGWAPQSYAQFEIEYPNGKLAIEGRIRAAFVKRFYFDNEDKFEDDRFYIHQARMEITGEMYEHYEYEAEIEIRAHDGKLEAKDLRISYEPRTEFSLTVGQFKVPYSRDKLIPVYLQSTIKRPDLTHTFVPGRDRGIMLRLRTMDLKYVLYAGVFSGNGGNKKENDDKGKFLYAARLEMAPLGPIDKEEGDYMLTPELRFLAGANIAFSDDNGPPEEDAEYLRTILGKKTIYGGDVSFKYRGLFLAAEFNHAQFKPDSGAEYKAGGFLLHAGYFIRSLSLEPVIEYDEFNPTDLIEDVTQRSIVFGLNYLPFEHDIKLMANYYYRLKSDSDNENPWKENEIRVLMQVMIR
ncbi:MAG: hypothetical protein GF307_12510 [candidate division Zixibacteria bacterium]|nr:hypothetical protein [candidate division Zixibacteria bacterium]